ncbi:MAG: CorA family divalent cation transporter [Peptostreptococcaceae bacterium]
MYLINFDKKQKLENLNYNENDKYLILCESCELNKIRDELDLDEETFNECLSFDENIKLDALEKYDFLSLNTFSINESKIAMKEVNIYLSDNFILVVCNKDYFLSNIIVNIINDNTNKYYKYQSDEILFMITYKIFKNIIVNQFENLEKLEDIILKIEDEIIDDISDQIDEINYIRNMTRVIVRNTRPYIYIYDNIFGENSRYKKPNDINIHSVNFSIEKLYSFSLSTRELSDKLLDIYSSNISQNTNDLISKLTLLTVISAPLTIITGIYGMNFEFMPELNYNYAYPIVLFIMIFIVLISLVIFKVKKLL